MKIRRPLFPSAFLLSGVLTGCTVTTYSDPSGAKFTRASLGTTQSIGAIRVEAAGDKKVLTVEGYTNEQAQVAGAVVEAAIKARLP